MNAPTTLRVALCSGVGRSDTRKDTGRDYDGVAVGDIARMAGGPPAVPKDRSRWVIPSAYRGPDARSHKVQAAAGEFWILPLDIDGGDLDLAAVEGAIIATVGDVDRIIYSTSSSTPSARKWRAVVPLAAPIPGPDYSDTVRAFNDLLVARSGGKVEPDRALERAGQVFYLPNRGAFYEHRLARGAGGRLSLGDDHAIVVRRTALRREREEIERAAREDRARRLAARREPEGGSVVDDFNSRHAIAELLLRYDYTPDGDSDDWRSRYQASGTYATHDYGDHWISLSASDAAAGIGRSCSSGCYGDAFDLFVHYEHGGDFNAAVRSYGAELRRRDAQDTYTPILNQHGEPYDDLARQILDDIAAHIPDAATKAEKPAGLKASPFSWIDPRTLPMREWLYGEHYIRKFIGVTVAPGGVGKSSLAIAEALAMASGKPLLGIEPRGRSRVWLWNGEDPLDELQRRVMATAMHYGLTPADLEGYLFLDSGRSSRIVIAEQGKTGVTIAHPTVDALIGTIRENRIDVVVVDPFVRSHRVTENDNNAIDAVANQWADIADATGCAVELVHHSKKTGGAEVTVEDSRGGVALTSAARSVRTLNGMTKEEAERAGVERPRLHFRVDNGKANLAPPPEGSTWFRLVGVPLRNNPDPLEDGDRIGVVTAWQWPDQTAGVTDDDLRRVQRAVECGEWRADPQAAAWVGKAVAQALDLDLTLKADRARVNALLRMWTDCGALRIVEGLDDKRRPRKFVEVGHRPDA